MDTPQPAHVLRGHFGDVQSVSFWSEERLFSGDCNGELKLWDLDACRAEYTVRLHDTNAGILQLVCLPALGVLVSQGRDGCVQLWPVERLGGATRPPALHKYLTESFNYCRCAVWAPAAAPQSGAGASAGLRDAFLACAAPDPADVCVWRPAETRAPAVLLRQGAGGEPKHGMAMALSFLASEPPIATIQQQQQQQPSRQPPSGQQHERDPEHARSQERGTPTREPAGQLSPEEGSATALAAAGAASLAAEAALAAAGAASLAAEAAGATGGASASPEQGAQAPRYVAAGYEDGAVAVWDARSPGRPLASARVHSEPIMCMDALPYGGGGGGGGAGRRGAGAVAGSGSAGPGAGAIGGAGAGSSGGGPREAAPGDGAPPLASWRIVTGSADDVVGCCAAAPGSHTPLRQLGADAPLKLREAGTADVRIRPDGKLFACGCWDGRVRLYSLRKRQPLAILKYHRGQVTSLAFSPERLLLASASRDTTVALWDVYARSPGGGGA